MTPPATADDVNKSGDEVDGDILFSDKDYVGRNINKDMRIYAYYECNYSSGDMKSF